MHLEIRLEWNGFGVKGYVPYLDAPPPISIEESFHNIDVVDFAQSFVFAMPSLEHLLLNVPLEGEHLWKISRDSNGDEVYMDRVPVKSFDDTIADIIRSS